MNITTWLCLIIILLLLLLIAAVLHGIKLSQLFYRLTSKNIRDSVQSKNLDLSPSTQSLIEVAIEVWRLEKRLQKTAESLSDDQNKAFDNSLAKLQRYLEKNDISLVDYTGKKYNEGMNLDILSTEKDPEIPHSIVKETHEPAVFNKGRLIKQAKVVILEK